MDPSTSDRPPEHALEIAREWLRRMDASSDLEAEFESLVPQPLTPEIARAVHFFAENQLQAQEWTSAGAVAGMATLAFSRLGLDSDALGARLDSLFAVFMETEAVDDYRRLRSELEALALTATRSARPDLVPRAMTCSGGCAFFAAQGIPDDYEHREDRAPLLRMALADATWALRAHAAEGSPASLQLLSLLVSTLRQLRGPTTDASWHDELESARRRLASAVEAGAAPGFEIAGDPELTRVWHLELGELLYQYGAADAAEAFAQRALDPSIAADRWIRAASVLYRAARESIDPKITLVGLRRRGRSRAEEYRQKFRSRAGRLWAGRELDHWLGEGLRDDLMAATWGGESLGDAEASALVQDGERTKARVLLDRLAATPYSDPPTPEIRKAARDLEATVLRLEAARLEGLAGEEMRLASMLAPMTMAGDADERAPALEQAEDMLEAHGAGLSGGASIPAAAEVMAALQPDEVLLDYFNPYDVYEPSSQAFCAVLTTADMRWAQIRQILPTEDFGLIGRISADHAAPVDSSPLGMQVVLLRMAIRDGDDAAAESILHTLWEILIAPVIEAGRAPEDARRWIIAPQGVLHYVPWPALKDADGAFLGDRVSLCLAPSASVWHRLAATARPPVARGLILGNPAIDDPGYPVLLEAESEAAEVADLLAALKVGVHTGAQATEETLEREGPNASILHLATHGEFPEEDALDLHRLLLAGTAAHDGHVHAEELRELDLSAARLVTLSVCNGGTFRFGPGDEPYGLIPALLAAGAEHVLGTLWPIEDRVGRAFASEFYEHLLELGPARALSAAMAAMRAGGAPVRDWAAFVLTGTGRPIDGRS